MVVHRGWLTVAPGREWFDGSPPLFTPDQVTSVGWSWRRKPLRVQEWRIGVGHVYHRDIDSDPRFDLSPRFNEIIGGEPAFQLGPWVTYDARAGTAPDGSAWVVSRFIDRQLIHEVAINPVPHLGPAGYVPAGARAAVVEWRHRLAPRRWSMDILLEVMHFMADTQPPAESGSREPVYVVIHDGRMTLVFESRFGTDRPVDLWPVRMDELVADPELSVRMREPEVNIDRDYWKNVRARLEEVVGLMGAWQRPSTSVLEWRGKMSRLGDGLDRPGVDMRQRMEQLIGLGHRLARVWEAVRPRKGWRERLSGASVQGLAAAVSRSGTLSDDLNDRIYAAVDEQLSEAGVTDATEAERRGLWVLILAVYDDATSQT